MEIKQLTNEEFNKFTSSFKIKSIYQTVEYGFIMNHQNFDSVLLGLVDNNHILAASLILIEPKGKIKYAYAPRGFLVDYQDMELLTIFTNEMKNYLSKLGIISIKINPLIIKNIYDKKYNVNNQNQYYDTIFENLKKLGYKHLGYNECFESFKPRFEAIIDLEKPYYLLFKNFRKEFRTKIRAASKYGIEVYKGNEKNLEYLYLQTKKKYPRDLEYFKDCYKYFSKNNKIQFYYTKLNTEKYLKICTDNFHKQEKICNDLNNKLMKENSLKLVNMKLEADKLLNKYKKELIHATRYLRDKPEGIITSSALIVKNYKEIYLLMDGFNTNYKRLNSKHLLIWKLCEQYSNLGYQTFNLGGMTSLNLENNKYQGLNDFKLGFNAQSYEYIGDLELICNNALYFMYQNNPIKNILKK